MKNLQENIVPAENQNSDFYFTVSEGEGLKVLFVGNSITKHEPRPEIGWYKDCGMAATCIENDYVHILKNKIEQVSSNASIRILQVAEYERNFENIDTVSYYAKVFDFKPDIVIMFFGANVPNTYETQIEHKKTFGRAFEDLRNLLDNGNTIFIISQGFFIRPLLDAEKEAIAKKYNDIFVKIEDIRNREDTHGEFNHPNDIGMQKIAERFWEILRPNIITKNS